MMKVVTSHKAKCIALITGYEVQFKPNTRRQRHFEAGRLISWANQVNEENAKKTPTATASPFEPPWTTAHWHNSWWNCSKYHGQGVCLASTSALFRANGLDWEMKYREEVRRVEAAMQAVRPETSITETRASVPGLRPEKMALLKHWRDL